MMKNKWLMVFIMVFLLSMTACGNGNQAEDGKKNATVEQKDSVALEKESGNTYGIHFSEETNQMGTRMPIEVFKV